MSQKSVKHVVLIKFKEQVDAAKIQELIEGYQALPAKIESMKHFEWGTDISVEGLSEGFTHCFITTFDSVEGRDSYVPHEAHQAYVGELLPNIEKLLVLDFAPQS